ncbi:endonuclease/exonuclease/phosphatase family protein [Sediminicola sp. 1XM1-17]|uniref:endonuclease/exonuclease/phosphatase family protein n=1 Tax=Sediminicola sp. 1XM1-17 TaxID=3127702 RepID=UPI0030772CFA
MDSSSLKSKLTLKLFLQIFGGVAIILTIFPFVAVDHWSVRVFDFPHLQLTLLTMFALLTYFIKFNIHKVSDYLFVTTLLACFIFQGIKIFPYTAFSQFEMNDSSAKADQEFSIYIANVLQSNDNVQGVIQDAERFQADLALFTETNAEWIRHLKTAFDGKYKYQMKKAEENTYGMILFSKFPLEDGHVRFLVEDSIPSIHTKLILPSGDKVQLYAIHPAPPTPQHNPSSADRDAELMRIAQLTRDSDLPVIVMGDFNDVAWSETTELFQKMSGLLDLRKGRGLFNTYNAKNWLMRWPLDHIYSSAVFRVGDVQLGGKTGSDHFPFFTKLSFEPELAAEQRLPAPSQKEIEEAFEQIKNEKKEDTSKAKK